MVLGELGPGHLGPGQLGPGLLGPGQLGPGAQLSGAQLSTLKKWTVGPGQVATLALLQEKGAKEQNSDT